MAGIYCADIYCDNCTDKIKDDICVDLFSCVENATNMDNDGLLNLVDLTEVSDSDGIRDQLDHASEHYYDSSEYPKWCDESDESDCPQHCGQCHEFLYNDLTTDGANYVRDIVNEDLLSGCMDSVAVLEWMTYYDYIDYVEQCNDCSCYSEDLDEGLCESCYEAENSPQHGDYVISPSGYLGGKSWLSQVDSNFGIEFDCDEEAVKYARERMDDEHFWTDIWVCSDHGNYHRWAD